MFLLKNFLNPDLFNVDFNSNMLFGLILMSVGFTVLYNTTHARGGGRFKGKIPLIIISIGIMVWGLFLLIFGWSHALR